ncbi:DNA repair protein XRCC4 isoform X3 [Pogona vitticeps]
MRSRKRNGQGREREIVNWMLLEMKVIRIHPVSDPHTTYFLQISWQKDLDTGFEVVLSDGQAAWNGRVSKEEISKEAADMEMDLEKYVGELRKVLLFEGGHADTYNFHISKEGMNKDYLQFSYEKNLKDVSFRLGSLMLQEVSSPAEIISKLISHCLDCMAGLEAKNECLQRENETLLSDLNDIQGQLQKCVEAKEKLENELYQRFILVLNEKKAKIRSLNKSLKEAEEMVKKSNQARDSIATSESKVERDVYEGSTDEESENLTQPSTSAPAVKPRRDSLLSNADTTDVAPCRKRRQRMLKVTSSEPKVPLYEAPKTARENTVLSILTDSSSGILGSILSQPNLEISGNETGTFCMQIFQVWCTLK